MLLVRFRFFLGIKYYLHLYKYCIQKHLIYKWQWNVLRGSALFYTYGKRKRHLSSVCLHIVRATTTTTEKPVVWMWMRCIVECSGRKCEWELKDNINGCLIWFCLTEFAPFSVVAPTDTQKLVFGDRSFVNSPFLINYFCISLFHVQHAHSWYQGSFWTLCYSS